MKKNESPTRSLHYPFAAIVGQDELKLALTLTAIDPTIGGVLALGDRGTGKSTAIRALADLLPDLLVVQNCAYGCAPTGNRLCSECQVRLAELASAKPKSAKAKANSEAAAGLPTRVAKVPVIDLPLGASEDRVVGSLDIEKALSQGIKAFEPGLLAAANRGYLYIDEVNLLDDHLVDLLIDVAASGENVVERDGLSVRHPARFVLIGSGNPEEGELRPQLLDRFGLSCEIRTPSDIKLRVEIIKRRDQFDQHGEAFCAQWDPANKALRDSIEAARQRLSKVKVSDELHETAAKLCVAAGTDGLRGELTLLRCMRAMAALDGKREARVEHLIDIAIPSLRHRLRRNPLDDSGSSVRVTKALQSIGLVT
jgi:magnesium chelatase subunit I